MELWIEMTVVWNFCRNVINDKSLGEDQTKKRKIMLKQLKDEVMESVVEKNIDDDVPLRGRWL